MVSFDPSVALMLSVIFFLGMLGYGWLKLRKGVSMCICVSVSEGRFTPWSNPCPPRCTPALQWPQQHSSHLVPVKRFQPREMLLSLSVGKKRGVEGVDVGMGVGQRGVVEVVVMPQWVFSFSPPMCAETPQHSNLFHIPKTNQAAFALRQRTGGEVGFLESIRAFTCS